MWWHTVPHGKGKWRGNWRMEWVASSLHTTSEHGVSSITTTDAHTSAASSRVKWRPQRFKWTRPFQRKTKSDFCACAITFQTQSTYMRTGDIFRRNHLVFSWHFIYCYISSCRKQQFFIAFINNATYFGPSDELSSGIEYIFTTPSMYRTVHLSWKLRAVEGGAMQRKIEVQGKRPVLVRITGWSLMWFWPCIVVNMWK